MNNTKLYGELKIHQWINIEKRLPEHLGFVYIITHKETGKFYVGKKQFYKAIRRKPLKGQKRVRLDKVESDWETYWGSSNKFQEYVSQEGKDKFERRILELCNSKFDLAYKELQHQLRLNVLFDPLSYNEILNIRLRKAKK